MAGKGNRRCASVGSLGNEYCKCSRIASRAVERGVASSSSEICPVAIWVVV